jgi:hypothetical protein
MCCICFEYTSFEDLWIDKDGTWDMCWRCGWIESQFVRLRQAGLTRDEILDYMRSLTPLAPKW